MTQRFTARSGLNPGDNARVMDSTLREAIRAQQLRELQFSR